MWWNGTDQVNRRAPARFLIFALILLVTGIAAQQTAVEPDPANEDSIAVLCSLEDSFAVIARKARPGVVSIRAVHTGASGSITSADWYDSHRARAALEEQTGYIHSVQAPKSLPGTSQTVTATGSGVIVRHDGDIYYILTNQHVVGNAIRVKVRLMDETELKGRVVGIDPVTDLAVVAISSPKLSDDNVLPLGDSNDVEVGAWAIALGSPLGFEETMTLGIVSALKRQLEDEETFYTDLIQTDAAINPGNSGGPLLDVEGRVIGISTAIASPTGGFVGLGFAIPINVAKSVLDTLIKNGRVIRGWLGVGIQELSLPLQEYYSSDKGVLVASVDSAGPSRSALREEDIVLSIDGTPVDDIFRVQSIIAAAKPGDPMRLTVLRAHKNQDVSVLIGMSPKTPPAPSPDPESQRHNLGLRVRTLSGDLAARVGLQGIKGVIVVAIESGGIAEEAGLDVGDVITRMNNEAIESDKGFATMVERIQAMGVIALRVLRDGSPRIIGMKRE